MPGCHHHHDHADGIVRNEPWYDHEREFVKVCHCERCVHGIADDIMDALRAHFRGTEMQLVACPSPGRCEEGNNVVVNDDVLIVHDAKAVAGEVDRLLQRQREQKRLHPERQRDVVKVCFGPTCGQFIARDLEKRLQQQYKSSSNVRLLRCGCTGNCAKRNNVVINGNIVHRQTVQSVVPAVESRLVKDRLERIKKTGAISSDEAEDILGL